MSKRKRPGPGAHETSTKAARASEGRSGRGATVPATGPRSVPKVRRPRASAAVAVPSAGAAALPATVVRIVREHAGAAGTRKNMFVPQGLLDRARKALGVKTETEAVALGLGAAVDLAEFQQEMLAGFDGLMRTGGLSSVEDEEVVLDGFRARPAR